MADPNPFASAIGTIVTGRDVELAVLRFLKRWAGAYLAECERQRGFAPGALPRIRTWTIANEFETWPEDQLPCLLLVSPGLAEAPMPDGAGVYRAKFTLGLAVIVSARTGDETAALAKLYCAAMRAAILQHQSLEGFATGVEWIDENYDARRSLRLKSRALPDVGTGQQRRRTIRLRRPSPTRHHYPTTRTPKAWGSS
jgi:hypothetical protein